MAITLLQAVNKVLKRAQIITSDLASLTEPAIQSDVDVAVQAWNETIDELNRAGAYPTSLGEGSFTLVAGTRTYAFASDFSALADDHFGQPVLMNKINGQVIRFYPGGWDGMRRDQLKPADFTGRPNYWVIDPTTGQIYFDQIPTAAEAGDIYYYIYKKRTNISSASDTFPILDEMIDTLVPAVTQIWSRERKSKFDADVYRQSLSRGAAMIRRQPRRQRYA